MPDDKNVDMPVFFPDGVGNEDVLRGAVEEFYQQVEKIRAIENAYLDRLVADMELLVSSDMAEHVNAVTATEKLTDEQEKAEPNEDQGEGVELAFPFSFPEQRPLLEQWKDVFVKEVLRVECHHNSLEVKKSYTNFFLNVHPVRRFHKESGTAPQRTQDSGWYATLKHALFG